MARAAIVRRLCGLSGGLLLVVRLLLGRLDCMRMLGLHGSVLLLLLVMLVMLMAMVMLAMMAVQLKIVD